ncbi:terminase small subunit [Labrenzia sp. CP4]|uniref:terminase small subunit n=1 Tax=Labrenzia sp. CP4 TaxID=1674922 RepID=UPI0009EF2191|nr:terminase small subunit [Labrenzia sp. CP4]
MNATQAAIRAGYSEKTAKDIGCQNLAKLDIAEAISEAQSQRSQRTQITQDRVLQETGKDQAPNFRRPQKRRQPPLNIALACYQMLWSLTWPMWHVPLFSVDPPKDFFGVTTREHKLITFSAC